MDVFRMSIITINSENFQDVIKTEKPVLLDFYADWCGPCKMMAPIVEKIAEEHHEYVVGKINVDDEPMLAREFGVASIPTLVVMKDGREATKEIGVHSEAELLEMLG